MPKILVWRRTGKIGRRQYSSLAQSVEHSAVNRVVVGSSPTGGAKEKPPDWVVFSLAPFIELKTRTIRTTQPSRLLTGPRLPAAGGRRREATDTADTRSLQATLGAPKGSLVSTRSLSLVRAQQGEPKNKALRKKCIVFLCLCPQGHNIIYP